MIDSLLEMGFIIISDDEYKFESDGFEMIVCLPGYIFIIEINGTVVATDIIVSNLLLLGKIKNYIRQYKIKSILK